MYESQDTVDRIYNKKKTSVSENSKKRNDDD